MNTLPPHASNSKTPRSSPSRRAINLRGVKKRERQLGMSIGKANGRLRKNILFHLLQKSGENVCFVCKTSIDTPEELSIEHKLPWQNRDTALFWDLDNIAFSHLRCNKPHKYSTPANKIDIPEGQGWCSGCRALLPIDMFHKHTSRENGSGHTCKSCKAKQKRNQKKKV